MERDRDRTGRKEGRQTDTENKKENHVNHFQGFSRINPKFRLSKERLIQENYHKRGKGLVLREYCDHKTCVFNFGKGFFF